ncbi:MAG: DUF5916 domain-containing protein [bacterium]
MKYTVLIPLLLILFNSIGWGVLSDRWGVELNRISGASVYKIFPVFMPHKPIIDGILSDACWVVAKNSPSSQADNFVYWPSNEDYISEESTTVYVAYDEKYIYFAFECYKYDVKNIVSDLLVRDSDLWFDDHIEVILDTDYDRSTAYYFGVTPKNVQMDGFISKDGELDNRNWDCVWFSKTAVMDDRWIAELAIPFRAFRFNLGEEKKWGVNFIRVDRKEDSFTIWKNTGGDVYNVSKYGTLVLKHKIDTSSTLDLLPYVSGEIDWKTSKERGKDLGAGLDFQTRLIPSMTISGTVFPDYAQIEADPDMINLEPNQELYYDEKRPFFLDGQEHFFTPIEIFYPRRIGKINWGGKIMGRIGGFSYYVMDVRANDARMMKKADAPFYNFGVVRTVYDIRHDLSLGFTGVDRRREDERTTAGGIDTKYSIGDILTFDFQYTMLDKPILADRLSSYYISAYRNSSGLSFDFGYDDIAGGFSQCETGYIPYDDEKGGWGQMDYSIWLYNKGIERINLYGYGDYYRDHNGRDIYWDQQGGIGVSLMNNLRFDYYYSRKLRVWESGLLREPLKNHYNEFFVGYNLKEWSNVYFDYQFGKHWWWNLDYVSFGSSFKVLPRLALELYTEYGRYEKRDEFYEGYEREIVKYEPVENLWIFVVKWNFQITHNMFFRTFLQSSGYDNTWMINALIGYNYYKGSHIYLAYNEWREYSAPGKPLLARILLLKGDFYLGF